MVVLICDFDETITSQDTIGLLAKLPYVDPPFPPPWSHFTATYADGYSLYERAPRSLPLLDPHTPLTAANYRQLLQAEIRYQDSLRPIELHSVHELERLHAFAGIPTEQVATYAHSLCQSVRHDFLPLWRRASQLHILSVNWSHEFIKDIIYSAARHSLDDPENLPVPIIKCNNLLVRNGSYTGLFDKSILTGADKLASLEKTLHSIPSDEPVWYIGDSETDLLSILHPKVNGVLLLDPSQNYDKFNKIAATILGLDLASTQKFACDPYQQSWSIPCKGNGSHFYLVKSWTALSRIIR